MFKKILLGVLLLAIIAFGGLSFYVSTIDWNKYKADIAQKFSELTGKEIEINGSINVSLLPHPSLKANDVSIYNQSDEKDALATIKKMNMSVSLASVLNGAPDISSLSLSNAEIWIKQDEKGKLNWSFPNKDTSLASGKTNLQNLNLQNATFHYENESADIKFDIKKVNAEIQAEAIGGPYRMDGNFIKDNDHFAIAVGVGSLNSLDGIETNFSISHPASESYFRFDGVYNPQDNNIKGDFSGGSKKTAQFANAISGMPLLDPENEKELQFSSGAEADVNLLKLSSFVIKYGEDIEGSGSLTYPLSVAENQKRKIDLKYEFLNFDIRPFISAAKAEYQKYKDNGEVYLPDTGFDITADLAAKHVDFNDTDQGYLENVTVKASWEDNVLSIDEFYANGVGDTAISISGDLREENTRPKYFAKASVISVDFLAFANSLGAELKSHVQSSYHNAKFDFSVVGDDGGFEMENAEFSMDKMKMNVDFSTLFMLKNVNFKLKVLTDNFNFDTYLPNDEENRKFSEQLQEDLKTVALCKDWDFEVDFSAENAVFRRTPISSLNMKIKGEKGIVTLDELSATKLAGANINITGQLNITKDPLKMEKLTVDIGAENISELISQINLEVPAWKIFRAKSFKLSSENSGSINDFSTKTDLEIGGTTIGYNGSVKKGENISFKGDLGIKTLNLGQFFEGINIDVTNFPNKNGTFNCEGKVKFNDGNFYYKKFKCLVGTANYDGSIAFTKQDKKRVIDATLNADEFNLSYIFDFTPSKSSGFSSETSISNTFISRPDLSRDLLNFSRYKDSEINLSVKATKGILKRMVFEKMSFKLSNKDKILKIDDIDTDYKNAHYSGDLSFSYNNSENPSMSSHVEFSDLDIGLIGGSTYVFNNGKISGKADIESRGASAYELFSNMSGDIALKVSDLNFKGFNLAAIQRDIASRKYSKGLFQAIRDNLQSGETQFNTFDVDMSVKNGALSVTNLEISSPNAKSNVSFDVDLKDWKINSKMVVLLSNVGDVPSFEASLTGMLQKPSLEINIENIVKHYDQYWKDIEDKENAEKENNQKELNKTMADAQEKLSKLSTDVNSYVPRIEKYKQNSQKADNIVWYENKLREINSINRDIDNMKSKAHTPDFTDDDVLTINTRIANYTKDIAAWNNELSKRHDEDIKYISDKLMNKKSDIVTKSQKLKEEYEGLLADKTKFLAKIKKDERLNSNYSVREKTKQFKIINYRINSQSDKINKLLTSLNSATDDEQKIKILTDAESTVDRLSESFNNGTVTQAKLIELITNVSEEIFNSHKREKSKQNADNVADGKASQNQNVNISVNNNESVSFEKNRILRNPDTQAVSSDNLPKNVSEPKGIIIKSYDAREKQIEPQAPKKGLLREVSGAAKKASGTIIVK